MQESRAPMMIVKLGNHFPLRVTDWLLAGIMTSWGMVLLYLDPATWSLPIYSGLRAFASQQAWGLFCFAWGAARMTALFINGALRRTPHVRGFGAFCSVFVWLQMSFAMFQADVVTAAIAIYPWLFLADIYNVYRASQDARESDLRAKTKRERKQQGVAGDAVSA